MKRVIFVSLAGLAVLALALLAAGLTGGVGHTDTAVANGGCQKHQDCPPGYLCFPSGCYQMQCQQPSDCNDYTYCNGQETCVQGWCTWGAPPDCDDQNPCTTDSCNEEMHDCDHTPVQDGTSCPGGQCQGGQCVPVGPPPVPEENRYGLHLEVHVDCPIGSETASLDGWITTLHDFDSLGDRDGNGREEIDTEIISLELTGDSMMLGPVTIRLRDPAKHPFLRSTGEFEEQVNNNAGLLDVGPFAVGTADAFYDVFFELQAPDVALVAHNDAPLLMTAVISDLLGPATYAGEAGAIPLRDEQENPIGCDVSNLAASVSAPGVGGIVELGVGRSDAPAQAAEGGGASPPYAAIAGIAAACGLALAAGGWYARRRLS